MEDTMNIVSEQLHPTIRLAKFFAALWSIFCDGCTIDGADLQDVLERSGFCRWREITEEEAENGDCDYQAGDTVLDLNEAGRAILRRAEES
jgi:hypothetical protein